MTHQLLQDFEKALRKRNPQAADHLQKGMSETQIRKKLGEAGATGNIEPIVQLYTWKNGIDPGLRMTSQEASPFPHSSWVFMDFSMMLGDFESFKEAAVYHPRYRDLVGRYLPLFWDGSDNWLAVDLVPDKRSRMVLLVMQHENAVFEVYETFDSFLADATRANNANDELLCFSQPLPTERTEHCCTFCREPLSKVGNLLESEHGAAICRHCVALCYDVMRRNGADLAVPAESIVRLHWIRPAGREAID